MTHKGVSMQQKLNKQQQRTKFGTGVLGGEFGAHFVEFVLELALLIGARLLGATKHKQNWCENRRNRQGNEN
jgi:hypothetical protein